MTTKQIREAYRKASTERIKGAIRVAMSSAERDPRRAPPDVLALVVAFLTEEVGPKWVATNAALIEWVVWGPELGAPLTDHQARLERWWYST